MFYNTTNEHGSTLHHSTAKATGQDEMILDYFKAHPSSLCTPDEVLESLFTSQTPITSIRRSINTLTKALFLTKTGDMRMGRYGKLTHCWKLRTLNNQLPLL